MTYEDKNGNVVVIRRQFNPKTSNIDYFTDIPASTDPALVVALTAQQVNLSRGHTRMYGLTNLSDHNGTGACWTDGASYHTSGDQKRYTERVDKALQSALDAAGKAYVKAIENRRFDTAPVVIGTLSVA